MLLINLLKKKKHLPVAGIALFADKIALVYQAERTWVADELPINGAVDWPDAIRNLLDRHSLKGRRLRLVLGHGLYQSMLIDKPELPREEYPTALPYLVRELVNEPPQSLVADGFVAPLKERLQAFSTQRRYIEQLEKVCREAGCELHTVSAEEVVLGQLTHVSQSQLILHRRGKGNLQLSAYKQQVLCFQRQLRGFSVPLLATDDEQALEKGLQLDSLALELQRSLDFLSAQLRDAPITQLLISCDDDDDGQLAAALSQRLSVKVEAVNPVFDTLNTNSYRVAFAAAIEPENSGINFYSDALKPKFELLTLPHIVMSWLAVVVMITTVAGWFGWQGYQQQQQLATAKNQLQQKVAAVDRAKAALVKHVPSPLKIEMADGLEQQLITQKEALEAIALHDEELKIGFAGMMQQLSDAANGDISLQSLQVTGRQLNLEGLARSPDAVPAWLQMFKQYPALADKRFQRMTLGRNEQNTVTFKLQAERRAATTGGDQ